MILSSKIAEDIIQKTKTILGQSIYIISPSGKVLAGETPIVDFKDYIEKTINRKTSIEFKPFNKTQSKEKNKKFVLAPLFFNKKVIAVFGLNSGPKKERDEISLIQSLAEVLIYEKEVIENLYSTTETINNFISDIFLDQSSIKSFKEAKIQAEILGLELKSNQACILINIEEFKENFFKKNKRLSFEEKSVAFKDYLGEIIIFIKNIFPKDEKDIVGYLKDNLFLLIKEIKGDYQNRKFSNAILKSSANLLFRELNKKFKGKITVGVGQFYPGLLGLRKSYHDAKIALEIGSKIWGSNKVFHILDIGMFISLGDAEFERKKELASQIFSPLFNKRDLLKTVEIFFDCGMNLTCAAKRLHLHRNTLVYRLLKIKRLLGLDPRNFYDAFQIKIGLIFTKEAKSLNNKPEVLSFITKKVDSQIRVVP